ncbi:MAG: hypothetical protein OEV00_07725 [Acidobacteriota bacterium]|nr:hypothetical protein [Acidobacteriota bacterium]MDH3785203.1 hypothetical protein [Acidobacteriota bacterium]
MRHFDTRTTVEPGIYFNLRHLRFRSMDEPGTLPGAADDRYYRVPLLLLLVAGPLIGLVYLVFLPFISLAMFAGFVVQKLARWTTEVGTAFARVLRPSWRPLAAFFERSRKARRRHPRNHDQWSEEVKKEMADDDTHAA